MKEVAALATSIQPGSKTPAPRLVHAAHEFEAQMMKELIKPLDQGTSLPDVDGDDKQDLGSATALGEFASEALGRALSDRGGFGIADNILKQLSRFGNRSSDLPVTEEMPGKTVIHAAK